MTKLYIKKGRRYVLWGYEAYDTDRLKAGTWRMTYCYQDGGHRYSYDVTPDTASFEAACLLARDAMEKAISEKAGAVPKPDGKGKPYTKKQQEIIKRFQAEMKEAGAMIPDWWTYGSAYDIAQAGIDAVKGWPNAKAQRRP